MAELRYFIGDATNPAARPAVIAHVCNDAGFFAAGFAAAVAERHPEAKRRYQSWAGGWTAANLSRPFRLGEIQGVLVTRDPDLWVCNMIAQHGLPSPVNPHPLDLEALETCLSKLSLSARSVDCPVVMPRIGTGLARGKWEDIEPLIQRHLVGPGVDVTVYDLPWEAGW